MLTSSVHFLIVPSPIFTSASRKISVHVSEFLLPRFAFDAVVNYLTAVADRLCQNVVLQRLWLAGFGTSVRLF